MSLWQFLESSQPLLKRCMELATVESNNKWIQKFGNKSEHFGKDEVSDTNTVNHQNDINDEAIPITNDPIEAMDIDEKPIFNPVRVKLERDDISREILDLEPITHFDYILEKCLENPNLYQILAEELPLNSIEKLFKHIYDTKNVNSTFLENFYTIFFPAFLKREPTRLSLDLLIKGKCYPLFHKHLLLIIFKDTELPSNILHDFVSTLNMNEQTEFLITLSHSDVPKEAFLYHLVTIHTAYKNSLKNNELQNYILAKLGHISENCATDKNYGRFLLNFLQSHKDYRTNITEIESIVETHRSAFKKPCLNILNEIKHVSKDK
ncbi:uncharacterized protein LOC123879514 [Maniola jurtina]|uniref:uncharacterized protein LOC123879514 n=1 Tax=Maniola jurtina TaxID=191418 RepID=UPI001E68C0F9|nr:uncharacterized protein LOC123879514 [Maniola jurtina]